MEDLELPSGSPGLEAGEEPQGNDDPRDPLRPDVEEENNTPTPPLANPDADMETREGDDTPGGDDDDEDDPRTTDAAVLDDDDLESELDELDEKEFENFDPSALNIPDKPLQVDESNVALLGVHKRKRTAEEEAERDRKKKRKEKKRDKPKRSKKYGDGEDDFEGGEEIDGKRSRKNKVGADGRPLKSAPRRAATPENEDDLSPEERKYMPYI